MSIQQLTRKSSLRKKSSTNVHVPSLPWQVQKTCLHVFFLLSNAPILANFISPSKRKGYYLQSDGSLELVVWKCRFLVSAVLLATELTLATRSLQPSIVPYIGFTPTQHVTAKLLEYPHEKKNRKRTEEI